MTKKLSELKEKILEDAEQEAEKVRSRAEKVKKRTIRTAKRKADRIINKAEQEQETRFEREKRRIKYDLEIKTRRKKLAIEQQIIDNLKQQLEEKLEAMWGNNELDNWIDSQLEDIVQENEEHFNLLCNPEDQSHFQEIADKHDIEVKTDSIKSGFILKSKKDEYDFQFYTLAENLVESKKDAILKTVHIPEDSNG